MANGVFIQNRLSAGRGGISGLQAVPHPFHMGKCPSRTVDTVIGMGTEDIALSLSGLTGRLSSWVRAPARAGMAMP